MDDERVLLNYYAMTVPNVTILAGSILALLFLLRIDLNLALGAFSTFYGLSLTIIHLIVREQFGRLRLYRLAFLFSASLILMGVALVASRFM